LQLVAEPTIEAVQHRLLQDVVVPGWLNRCGPACATIWNDTMGPRLGIRAGGG
jgi:hypothetical protein